MSWGYYGFRRYVSVGERRANAARELAKLQKKTGQTASPVTLEGRTIARTFWGKAWCDNLEAYSDYANRLPRGRSYVRNGSVVDLQIAEGKITALVSGSDLYRIKITIKPLAAQIWTCVQKDCAGKIDSLLELLQGKLSASVMEIVTRREAGLFPTPREIKLECSCPDWAGLCKHLAAVLYGIGARLDQKPELLFLLRGVDPAKLISQASAAEAVRQTATVETPGLGESDLAEVFGIEVETSAPASTAQQSAPPSQAKTEAKRVRTSKLRKPASRKTLVKGRTRRTNRIVAKTVNTSPTKVITEIAPAPIPRPAADAVSLTAFECESNVAVRRGRES